jgi:hypothetical protein
MFIGVPIKGCIASIAENRPKNDASVMGKVVRVFMRLPETVPSPGSDVVLVVEDDVRPRSFSRLESRVDNDVDDVDDAAGDARFCSVEVIVELSWDSADCTPLPVAVPLA